MRPRVVVVIAAVLALGACSDSAGYTVRTDPPTADPDDDADAAAVGDADDDDDTTVGDTPSAEATPSPATADVAAPSLPPGDAIVDGAANGLVLVFDQDAGSSAVASYQVDGTLVASYSTDADELIWQPIWSPDGRRVAFSSSADAGATWELVTVAVDGSDRTTHALPGRPDYLAYDPTASRVLALTPSPQGFGLAMVEVEAAGEPFTVLDLGSPYYSDFSPSGDRLIAHVAADMRVVGVDGTLEPLEYVSITNQTPSWHATDDRVFFSSDVGAGARLLSVDLGSGELVDLVGAGDFVYFDLAPAGDRLAVAAFGQPSRTATNALRRPTAQTGDDLTTGLWIVDAADGAATLLSPDPASSPMWDPTGTKVLVRDSITGEGSWHAYGPSGSHAVADVVDVTTTLLPAYLPFWDQYSRSQTLWAPDGSSFVHVGAAADGRGGVWLHDATATGPSSFLVDGDVAFWSPT